MTRRPYAANAPAGPVSSTTSPSRSSSSSRRTAAARTPRSARRSGLSEAAVRQRVQRLLDAGVMQIVAVTDPLHARASTARRWSASRSTATWRARRRSSPAIDEIDYVVICAGSFDLLVEVVCEDDEHLLESSTTRSARSRRHRHRDVRLPQAREADLLLGNPMSRPQPDDATRRRPRPATTSGCTSPGMSAYADADVPMIVRGEGAYVYDSNGKRYLDGLSGLFVVAGRPRPHELAEAAAEQAARARLLPAVDLRAPERDRARRPARRPRARRPQPGLLHHRRLRGGRVGVEAGPPVLQADRPARAGTR